MSEAKGDSLKDKILNELKADKRFFIRLFVIAVLLIIGYYLFSPYQNCKSADLNTGYCSKVTSW